MKVQIKQLIGSVLLCLIFMSTCKSLQNEGGADWATVKFLIDESNQSNANYSASTSSIKTALIIAVPMNISSVGNNNYLLPDYDKQLQNLANNTVNLRIPLNISIRLVKVVFQEKLTFDDIINSQPTAFCTGVSQAFFVKGNDADKIVSLTMDSVLYSKNITQFSFKAADNPTLSVDVEGTFSGSDINLAVPNETDVTSLIATFSTTGHKVIVGDTAQNSGLTVNDFTSALIYSVVCAYGETKDYAVTVNILPLVATPIFSPGTGTYTSAQTVTISTATDGATIKYTVDGSNPLTSQNFIEGTAGDSAALVEIVSSKTLKAYAHKSMWTNSTVVSATYTMNIPKIYVIEYSNHRIARMDDMSGKNWTTFGSFGVGINQFNNPTDIHMDDSGKIYVADLKNNRVVRMDDISGTNWTTFGTAGSGVNQFDWPYQVYVDSSGKIYIADYNNDRFIRMDDMSGTNWTAFGSFGSGVNQFNGPARIFVTSSGQIYVADYNNNRIVRIDDMSGTNWITFGTAGSGVNQFNLPIRVFVHEPTNQIYIGDRSNHRIVRIDDMSGTNWTTLGVNGTGTNQFCYTYGIYVNDVGKIYVAENCNHRIVSMDDMSGTNWTVLCDNPPSSCTAGSGINQFASPAGIFLN